MVAANGGLAANPGWYYNLKAHPRAHVEVEGRQLDVRAEELSPAEAAAFWSRVLKVAPNYAKYTRRTSRRIPLLRLVPLEPFPDGGPDPVAAPDSRTARSVSAGALGSYADGGG